MQADRQPGDKIQRKVHSNIIEKGGKEGIMDACISRRSAQVLVPPCIEGLLRDDSALGTECLERGEVFPSGGDVDICDSEPGRALDEIVGEEECEDDRSGKIGHEERVGVWLYSNGPDRDVERRDQDQDIEEPAIDRGFYQLSNSF